MHYLTLGNVTLGSSCLLSAISLPKNLLLAKIYSYKYAAMANRCLGNIELAENYSKKAIKTWVKTDLSETELMLSTVFLTLAACSGVADMWSNPAVPLLTNAIMMASVLQVGANVFGPRLFNITTQAGDLYYKRDFSYPERLSIQVDDDLHFERTNDPEQAIIRIDDVRNERYRDDPDAWRRDFINSTLKIPEIKDNKKTAPAA